MRYSLLDILACPVTGEDLVLLGVKEEANPIPDVYISPSRDNQSRNLSHVIVEGILFAPKSGRWYPIQDHLPILLPDSLRDWQADRAFLQGIAVRIDTKAVTAMLAMVDTVDNKPRPGDNHKSSEISLLDKVENTSDFLGPGYISPFHWGAYEHASALVRGFAVCMPFLQLNRGDFVLDSGSGYSWTTEWLQKMGINSVGIEINRTYVDVGRHRMGAMQPHLVVCDAENLPFKPNVFKAVLGFDAFHHIPNRNRAMQEFSRTMKSDGRVVLVEPGSAHTDHPVSIEVSEKYGTMEVGMSLDDVKSYVDGIASFATPIEHFIVTVSSEEKQTVSPDRSFIGWSLFTIDRHG